MDNLLAGFSEEITLDLDSSAIHWMSHCVSWLGLAHVNYPFHMPAKCRPMREWPPSSQQGGTQMGYQMVAGIDISKHFSNMCVMSASGDILLETKIFYDEVGLRHVREQLARLSNGRLHQIIAVMESTAHYHRILEQFLRNAGLEVMVINPIQSGSMKNLDIRKVKSDRSDARRLAQLYLFKMLRQTANDPAAIGSLKDLTRQRADIISERTRFSNKLTALLDQGFPGFKKVFSSLKVRSALAVLKDYPTPDRVLNAENGAIEAVISQASSKKGSSKWVAEKADLLYSTAGSAEQIGIHRDSFAVLISLYADMLLSLQRTAEEIEHQIFLLAKSDAGFWNSVCLLTSIPGIGQYSAVVILAEIGDFSRFSKPKQLVAFAGMDPAAKQSGTRVCTHNRLSKRGSPYLRSILDTCTHVAVHVGRNQHPSNPVLSSYYEDKRRSKPANVAMCACIHKMLGYIFAVLRNQELFELRTPQEHLEIMRRQAEKAA